MTPGFIGAACNMARYRRLHEALFILTLIVGMVFPASPATAQASAAESRAERRLENYLRKKLPARGLSMDCVSFLLEDSSGVYFEFAVRERHEGHCPGAPEVAPIVDRYRVPARGGAIRRYDPVNDRWLPAPR